MVKIKYSNHELQVTAGAFKSIYAPMGYTKVEEQPVEQPVTEPTVEEQPEPEQATLEEKPLSEMSNAELKDYAVRLGISTSGLRTRRELKQAIQAAQK